MANKLRLALLISGGGTTALEIIRACQSGRLKHVEPVCVICSKEGALGIERAKSRDVPVMLTLPHLYFSADNFGNHILSICRSYSADWIGQYGWMPKTPANVIQAFAGRMTNQHPGPIDPGHPDFGGQGMYGRRVHAARIFFVRATKRDSWTEATSQFVSAEYDRGAVIHKRTVEITPHDDPVELQQRVLPMEHQVQIEALEIISEGRVTELTRPERLVHPDEEATLSEAKHAARLLYPYG